MEDKVTVDRSEYEALRTLAHKALTPDRLNFVLPTLDIAVAWDEAVSGLIPRPSLPSATARSTWGTSSRCRSS